MPHLVDNKEKATCIIMWDLGHKLEEPRGTSCLKKNPHDM